MLFVSIYKKQKFHFMKLDTFVIYILEYCKMKMNNGSRSLYHTKLDSTTTLLDRMQTSTTTSAEQKE